VNDCDDIWFFDKDVRCLYCYNKADAVSIEEVDRLARLVYQNIFRIKTLDTDNVPVHSQTPSLSVARWD
jgi:ribosome-interacting GTPase 1